tara:strand:+ start:507 stop:638 length:132 start_codon:yes stop_codon:yes gene_type:complete
MDIELMINSFPKLLGATQVLCQNIRSGGKYYNDYNDKYFETAI